MSGRLEGKVAVITGGVSGMGLATVRRFVAEGARVVVGDLQGEPGERLAREFGEALRFQLTDVSREEDVAALVECAVGNFGRIDCMFNNAGYGGISAEVADIDLGEAYRRTIDVLFTGVLAGIKHAVRAMKAQDTGGSIINTASVAGLRAGFGPHVYSAMKSAVISITRSAAIEVGQHGIRVNAICPGFIATPIFAGGRNWNYDTRMKFAAALADTATPTTAIRRAGQGDDIAGMALYLASDDSAFVTGQQFVVDGGLTAGTVRDPNQPNSILALAERFESEDT